MSAAWWCTLSLAAATLCSSMASAQTLRVVTEQRPPMNFQENGQEKGLAVEMAKALFKESGLTAPIEFMPWNRAYSTALQTPNVLIFTIARSADREASFHWIQKVAPRETWLYGLKSRTDIRVKTLADAKAYMVGTGPSEDIQTKELLQSGFVLGENLDAIQADAPDAKNMQKLFLGRIDLLIANHLVAPYVAKQVGHRFDELVAVYPVVTGGPGFWIALSKDSDASLLKSLTTSSRRLEERGVFKAILDKYLQ